MYGLGFHPYRVTNFSTSAESLICYVCVPHGSVLCVLFSFLFFRLSVFSKQNFNQITSMMPCTTEKSLTGSLVYRAVPAAECPEICILFTAL